MAGYKPLDDCVTDAGLDQSTFVRWRRESPEMQVLFKRAQLKRNKMLKALMLKVVLIASGSSSKDIPL